MGTREYSPDYAPIASKYDEARSKFTIRYDRDLAVALERFEEGRGRSPDRDSSTYGTFTVLDVACGTGSYLLKQSESLSDRNIRWFGIDRSTDMLAMASKKNIPADLINAGVESLPFDDGSIDFAVCNFAFHHFTDKKGVLREIVRILKPTGTIKIHNMNPDKMSGWWVYRFFPETRGIDQKRFMPLEELWLELGLLGFDVRSRGKYATTKVPLKEIRGEAENRDISQIALLSDEEYRTGLARIDRELVRNPEATVFTENAILSVVAERE